ncbi:MAG: AAA family ATPase [Burkholderiales bacterium]
MIEDDSAHAGAARGLPDWATDWVLLRAVETPQLGRAKADARLYVPAVLGHIANAARARLEYQRPQGDEAKLRVQALLPPVEVDDAPEPKAGAPSVPGTAGTVPAPVVEEAAPRTKPRPTKLPKRLQGLRVRVIAEGALERYSAEIELLSKRKSKDDARADREHAAALLQRGGLRTVVLGRQWQEKLKRLAEEMPNFGAVIEHVRVCCALVRITGRPLHIPPILLGGMPGLGKTLFATRLAEALGVPRFVYALESAETMSTLTGSDKHWSNTEPGQLFRHIVLGEVANPLIVLDELDKATKGSGSSSGYRPATALHGPLEPVTAKALRDKSADLCFDASHVIYIATANRLSSIEGSLLSRFKLFHIEAPDARTAVAIARSVARAVLGEYGLARRFEVVTGEVLQQLAVLGSPRIQRQVLETAIGKAISDGRWALRVQDLWEPRDGAAGGSGLGPAPH